MKKITSLLAVSALSLTLLAGCSSSGNSLEKACKEGDFSVGFVTDQGGIDDRSFNQATYEGVRQAAQQSEGICYTFLASTSEAQYEPNLTAFATGPNKVDLVVASGFMLAPAVERVATANPDVNFLIIDAVVDLPNVTSAVFSEHEGSYLAGIAAGLKAKEAGQDTLGFLGGIEGEIIGRFENGFKQGVHAVHPEATILVEYAGSFTDVTAGKNLAAKMYNEGAYIIFHASGGTGNGLINEAIERAANGQEVYVIGVDRDQYEDGIFNGTDSVILTSMLKRVDTAAKDVILSMQAGKDTGGTVLQFNAKNGGVSLPETNPNLSDEIMKIVNQHAAKIASGEITVNP